MAPVGDYHGYSYVFDCFQCFWASLLKPVAKQAPNGTSVEYMAMLPLISDSFYYGIYKDYNHKKLGLTLK